MDKQEELLESLDAVIDEIVSSMEDADVYMPSIATVLRLKADELAERYPDDANGGIRR